MKQVLQSLDSGLTEVVDAPAPAVSPGRVLIQNEASLISSGTEGMLRSFGQSSLLGKVRQQPHRVRQVLDKVKTDGVLSTLDAVRSKLAQPIALGYCSTGTVIGVGAGVDGFEVGQRVVSNGPHAEVVSVPQNLCARIPDGPQTIAPEEAAFTVLGAVALQGLRLAEPTLGETFMVAGLGLVGLLAAQLLQANGCRVVGSDFNPSRLALARDLGVETVDLATGVDPVSRAMDVTGGRGVDGVLLTASTTSSEPVHQAAAMCRKRGRIVLVGVTGLELAREDFYEKELSFQVSCSYGPGRYDSDYEDGGHDYPLGFVRWTEQRNFAAVLDLLAAGRLDVARLISHRYPIDEAVEAYEQLESGEALGVVLEYPAPDVAPLRTVRVEPAARPTAGRLGVGLIGAGNYAQRVLLPAVAATGAQLVTVASRGGTSALIAARRFGFAEATTDVEAMLADERIGAVFVATQHGSHARLTVAALEAGKHVFVEKPLAIDAEQLDAVEAAYDRAIASSSAPLVCVGFNRRYAPLIEESRALLAELNGPLAAIMTVNAGHLPRTHWTRDPVRGGGRILGEACHFVDLLQFLAGATIERVSAVGLRPTSDLGGDTASISLELDDGSLGTVHYVTHGHPGHPKERLELYRDGRVIVMDNYRRLQTRGWGRFRPRLTLTQDKGHKALVAAFVDACQSGGVSPTPFSELLEVHRALLLAVEQLRR